MQKMIMSVFLALVCFYSVDANASGVILNGDLIIEVVL